jgi:uncharacterized membrane protein
MDMLCTLKFMKVALASMLIFIALDLIWLALVARRIYFRQLGYLAVIRNERVKFRLPVGLAVQAIIALGLAVMVTVSLQVNDTLTNAVLSGGFCGFVLYATYDLTCLSFIKDWPVPITVIDIAWGTTQGLMAGLYVFYLLRLA